MSYDPAKDPIANMRTISITPRRWLELIIENEGMCGGFCHDEKGFCRGCPIRDWCNINAQNTPNDAFVVKKVARAKRQLHGRDILDKWKEL